MARMHARKKGKSSSKKPYVSETPEWVTMKPKEIEDMVVQLYNEGKPPAMIGLLLRDQYAVPNVRLATGKSVVKILKENGVEAKFPEDLTNLMRKAVELYSHLKDNPRDKHNLRGVHLIEAKIRRLARYYKRTGVLPEDWNYSPATAELEIK
ncbi:MAG: 30S ribosomal protein S15 [Methanobacteriota archaeon]|nr:MAG: 30S ribosomal protein S15 [Euryarchaeota archaeon]